MSKRKINFSQRIIDINWIDKNQKYDCEFDLVVAVHYGSEGLKPAFKRSDSACVSGSGDSLCGGYMGHQEIELSDHFSGTTEEVNEEIEQEEVKLKGGKFYVVFCWNNLECIVCNDSHSPDWHILNQYEELQEFLSLFNTKNGWVASGIAGVTRSRDTDDLEMLAGELATGDYFNRAVKRDCPEYKQVIRDNWEKAKFALQYYINWDKLSKEQKSEIRDERFGFNKPYTGEDPATEKQLSFLKNLLETHGCVLKKEEPTKKEAGAAIGYLLGNSGFPSEILYEKETATTDS